MILFVAFFGSHRSLLVTRLAIHGPWVGSGRALCDGYCPCGDNTEIFCWFPRQPGPALPGVVLLLCASVDGSEVTH